MKRMQKILVAASMTGGAEAVAPVVKSLKAKGADVRVLSHAAATESFHTLKLSPEELTTFSKTKLRALLNDFQPDAILTGTQLQSKEVPVTMEQMLWDVAKKARINTVAIMDTWGSELERFSDLDTDSFAPPTITNKLSQLPDIIATIDLYQMGLMEDLGFPRAALALTGNPYFESVAREYSQLPPTTRTEVLAKPVFSKFDASSKLIVFMSDSISTYPDIGFTETSVLRSFLKVLDALASKSGNKVNVIVRPHPFRNEGALSAFDIETPNIQKVLHNPVTSRGADPENEYSMEQLLATSDLVVGTFNNPIITAKLVGKPVINYMPNLSSKYSFQEFLSEQGLSNRVLEESALGEVIQDILNGEIVQKSMEAVQGAAQRVIGLLQPSKRNQTLLSDIELVKMGDISRVKGIIKALEKKIETGELEAKECKKMIDFLLTHSSEWKDYHRMLEYAHEIMARELRASYDGFPTKDKVITEYEARLNELKETFSSQD